jgi:hypothetical protein
MEAWTRNWLHTVLREKLNSALTWSNSPVFMEPGVLTVGYLQDPATGQHPTTLFPEDKF